MNEAAVLALYEAVPEPIAVVDARSRLRSTNAAWRALHTSDPEMPLRTSLAVGDSDAARLEATVTAVATEGGGRRTVAVFGSVEGRTRFFELSASSITLRGEGAVAENLVVLHHHADTQNEDAALGARLSEHVLEQWPHMIFINACAQKRHANSRSYRRGGATAPG